MSAPTRLRHLHLQSLRSSFLLPWARWNSKITFDATDVSDLIDANLVSGGGPGLANITALLPVSVWLLITETYAVQDKSYRPKEVDDTKLLTTRKEALSL